ncbi:hypothetical protein [Desertivirga xinjiangensis]|uniref:hypothetical protein n=1 Tax=Desertivirga xinjiangensis TaxID=539206 RepID=UPI00210C4B71|nr:hypothetical protein [Pedobacter xinjiangensis]
MKSIICVFFLGILTLSCKKEDTAGLKEYSFNMPAFAKATEKILVKDTEAAITVELISVLDSRCPAATNCDDPGNCIVKIKISNINHSWSESILSIGDTESNNKDEVFVVMGKMIYQIRLINVNPKPGENAGTEKVAEFIVSREDF